jgi:predicted nucleic acid-binding protein
VGPLILPPTGLVYVDSSIVVYTVERHPDFGPLLNPLWEKVQAGVLRVITSELTLMETLVLPLRRHDAALADDFRQFLRLPGTSMASITLPVLENAAALRARHPTLRTPDALHLATSESAAAALFLTNDQRLRGIGSVPVISLT